jgi:hypothetical protein
MISQSQKGKQCIKDSFKESKQEGNGSFEFIQ